MPVFCDIQFKQTFIGENRKKLKKLFIQFFLATRAQEKLKIENGFVYKEEVRVRRMVRLDEILITAQRIVTRRVTVGPSVPPPSITPPPVTPPHGNHGSGRPIPPLLPLNAILKMPKRPPFNLQGRKSLPAKVLAKRSTTKMVIDVINRTTPRRPGPSNAVDAVAGPTQSDNSIPGPSGGSTQSRAQGAVPSPSNAVDADAHPSPAANAIPGTSSGSAQRQPSDNSAFRRLVYTYDSDSD